MSDRKASTRGAHAGAGGIDVVRVPYGAAEFAVLARIRRAVFVDEQGVDPAHEFDAQDEVATHFLARMEGMPAGVARLYGEYGVGRIGRVAVLARFRKAGVGRALMARAMAEAWREGYGRILLHSQTQAVEFYRRLGFEVAGGEFMEEGIPHVTMVCTQGEGGV